MSERFADAMHLFAEMVGVRPGPCTGRDARWCPVHGACTCKPGLDLVDPLCLLHGTLGTHRG